MSAQLAQIKKIKFDKKGRHVLGTKLGGGGAGDGIARFVYSLEKENGEDSDWCGKITKIAKPTTTFDSEQEIADRALVHERWMYQIALKDLQGHIIPRLPNTQLGDPKSLEAYKKDKDGTFSVLRFKASSSLLIHSFLSFIVSHSSYSCMK